MQNLTSLTQSSSGNITCAKNLTVTGTATFNSTVDLTGATITGATFTASAVSPDSDDGAALGTTSLKWSDLFLASGGVINFNSGNVTLTHSTGTLTMNNLLTLSGNTGITFTGTAITKGINFASAVAAMSDADDAFISCGTWNDAVVVGTQTAHFVPIQVHLHSAVSAAYDIAAARLRVDTSAANTANAVGCLQLRQSIGHNVASSAILNASVSVDGAVAVQTGSLLGGYFSIEGTGAITKAGSNDCTPLVAVNNNTGGGVDNVFIAMQNGTGTTVTDIMKAVAVHGTATNGLNVVASGGTIINGIVVTNATLGVTDSRAIKVSTSTADANMNDGYGVVEIDVSMTGTAGSSAFPMSALSSWVNIPSGTVGAGKMVCAQNNGIYEASAATITDAKIVFGMRAQYLCEDTDGLRFPFALNTNNAAITALFDVPNATDMGWVDGVLANETGDGHIPLFRDAAGIVHYVNTYVA